MEKVTKDEHTGECKMLGLLKIDVNLFTSDAPLMMIYHEFCQGWWGKKEDEGSSKEACNNYVPNEEWKHLQKTRMNDGNTIQAYQECIGDYGPMIGDANYLTCRANVFSNALALNAIRAGHWKRNCPQYLAELMKKKKKKTASGAGGSGSKGWDGIYEIDLSNSLTNESFVYAVSNKRAKLDLDSALLWHCRLGHISKKRIEKLQHDGLFNSSDLREFERCVSCMSGKMARKPYTHQVERAKD
nr:retrotransposon protein, putative, Ty1-copia subclass [Tanacetum cinerariifolium]